MLLQQAAAIGDRHVDWNLVGTVVANLAAFAALAQPWAISAWNKRFKRGAIDFYEAGRLALFFADNGIAIQVAGSIVAINEDQIIRRMKANIIRKSDLARHSLVWKSSRVASLDPGSGPPYVNAAVFLASTAQAVFIDAAFFDLELEKQLVPLQTEIQVAWLNHLETRSPILRTESSGVSAVLPVTPLPPEPPSVWNDDYEHLERRYAQFSKGDIAKDLKRSVERMCYWEAGSYTLELEIATARPDKSFKFQCAFELSPEGARRLQGNAEGIVRHWCEMPVPVGASYFFYVDYVCQPSGG